MTDIIFLLDEYESIIGHLSNQAEKACPYYGDILKEDLETGAQTFEFFVPAEHPDSARIKKNGYILLTGFDGKLMQFQISRVEETRNGEAVDIYVFCEFSWAELNGNIIRPYSLPGIAAEAAAVYALTGTRWQPGTVDYLGTADLSSQSYDTSLKMLQDIKAAFDADIRFYVTVKNNEITGRYVDIVEKVGSNEGLTIHFGKNLTGAKRIHDRANVSTALIGIGKGNESGEQITFSNVVWSKAKGHPADKPAGQDWIGDEEAREAWGVQGRHVTSVYEYNTTSPEVLLRKTWERLQQVKNGFLQYEASAAFLKDYGFDMTMANIGDTVTIQDSGFNPPLMVQARIIKLDRSFTDPQQRSATFGEYEPVLSQAAALAEIQSTLLKNEERWNTVPDFDIPDLPENVAEIIRTPIEPERSENIIWIDPATPSRPFDLIKTWDPATQTWKEAAPMQAGDIGGENLIIKQTTAPGHLSGRLWLDTSTIPNILYRSDGSKWIKITPTTPSDIGAENPESATNKAKVQAYQSLKNAVITDTTEAVNRGQIILDNSSYYTSSIVTNIRSAIQSVNTQSTALQTAINNAIADGIITSTEENNISTLKTQFDNAIGTATYYIQQSAQDAGGLRVGTITGITLNVTQAGMTNDSTGDAAVRLWAGQTFASRTAAPFRVQQDGTVYASKMNITGGNISISNSATIGSTLYLGSLNQYTQKYIYFNNNNYIGSDGSKFDIDGGLLWNTPGWSIDISSSAYILGNYNYMMITAGTLNLSAAVQATSLSVTGNNSSFSGTVSFNGQVTFGYGGRSYTYYNGEFTTGNYETGWCGTGSFNPSSGGTGGAVSGTGVNFRIRKNYVPGSISLSTSSHNVNGSANFAAIDISANGFWLYVNGSGRTGQFVYWRGTYYA